MSNQRSGHRVNRDDEWRRYDALPPEIKAILMRAPFCYAVGAVLKEWRAATAAGMSLAECRRHVIMVLADDLQRAAARDYGPDHPDALCHRVTGAPLDRPVRRRGTL